ncbi:PREDICTED: PRUPE_3G153900, partial [Prunus dulcis]
HRVKFANKLKESVMEALREETKKIEAMAKESVLEAVRAEREIFLKQFSQLIPNFDPNLLASCSNVISLVLEEDNPTNDADAAENRQDET